MKHSVILSRAIVSAITALFAAMPASAAEPALVLKDNDVWVMAGDSITAQRLHTNYIEAYYRTRYPQLTLHFRNSGVGGNTTGTVLARFDYDIAAWKPTIVSIELGMNDAGGQQDKYIKGMKELIARIRAIPAQPVLISSSPVDDGSLMGAWKSPRCKNIHPFTDALKQLAEEEKVVFVDQYHPLIDVWGQNRRKGAAIAAAKGTPPPPAAPAPAPAKPVLAASLVPLGGNPVHPGPVGQYTMAATILAGLKAQGAVSAAVLSAEGKVASASGCKITEVSAKDGKLAFTRLDEAGPWPIQPSAKPAVQVLPKMLGLSPYTLQVTGLAEGLYRVTVNGKPGAVVSSKDLAAGCNATTALDERAERILGLIATLQGKLNTEWRAASKVKNEASLASAQKAIEECERQVQAACQPEPLRFEIEKDSR